MGFIPEEIIAQILERSDIIQTITSYIPLKKTGRNFKACCPFHNEKTPSFVVNSDKQIFHCFGCNVGGNVINFVMLQEHLEFPEALRMLAQKTGITIPETSTAPSQNPNLKQSLFKINELTANFFHEQLISNHSPALKIPRDYLKNRGINLDMVKKFKIGFAFDEWDRLIDFLRSKNVGIGLIEKTGLVIPRENKEGYYDRFRNRIMFPIFDVQGNCVAFGGRTLKDDQVKYINSPETPVYIKGRHLYGLHLAKEAVVKKDFIVIVEGYMDFVVPFQAGIENISASLGTALTPEQIRLIRRYTTNVVMLFDADKAGQAANERSIEILIEEGMNVKVAALAAGEDPDSFIRKFGFSAFEEQLQNALSFFDFKLNQLTLRFDKNAIEGRALIAAAMLPLINKFDNAVMRFGYLRKLADVLQVSEESLAVEIKKIADKQATPPSVQPARAAEEPNEMGRRVEYLLLKVILQDETLIAATKLQFDPNDLEDSDAREVMIKIFKLHEENKDVNVASLMASFSNQVVLQKIASLIVQDNEVIEDKLRMHQDCLMRLKNNRLKKERLLLSQQIKQAESLGDHAQLDLLKEKYNQLIKIKG